MTTATVAINVTMAAARPRRSLEELVDRLFEAMFGVNTPAEEQPVEVNATRTIHEARRLRQAGDVDGALATLVGIDVTKATPEEARWAFTEWTQLVKRRFKGQDVMLYSQGTGRAAALVSHGSDSLEVVAVLGMTWRPGKVVSTRSLRGLKPLNGGA